MRRRGDHGTLALRMWKLLCGDMAGIQHANYSHNITHCRTPSSEDGPHSKRNCIQSAPPFNRPLHLWPTIPHHPATPGARDQTWHHPSQNEHNIATRSHSTATHPCPPMTGSLQHMIEWKQKRGRQEILQCMRESTYTPVGTPPPPPPGPGLTRATGADGVLHPLYPPPSPHAPPPFPTVPILFKFPLL